MNDRQLEELLNKELDALQRDIKPSKDLWPGIDHAINSPTYYGKKLFTLAASLVLALGLVFSGGYLNQGSSDALPDSSAFISSLRTTHETNKQTLMVQYQNHEPLAQNWESQMQQLEQAEQAIFEALRDDPGNLELLKLLGSVQGQQIDLIEAVFAPNITII